MADTAHDGTSATCRTLCDAVLAGIERSAGKSSRRKSPRWCVLRSSDRTIAWALHAKTKGELEIYLPSTPADSFQIKGRITPILRLSVTSAWARASSWHFRLSSELDVDDAVGLILEANERRSSRRVGTRTLPLLPEELPADEPLFEGAGQRITVNRYERDPRARRECIRAYKPKCSACGLDFATVYGAQFDGLITVHHLKPLSETGGRYRVDPARDLRPVCPNCHFIIHRRRPPYTIEEVQEMLRKRRDGG